MSDGSLASESQSTVKMSFCITTYRVRQAYNYDFSKNDVKNMSDF